VGSGTQGTAGQVTTVPFPHQLGWHPGPAVVLGQAGRDLVLLVDALPQPGGASRVHRRREVLGGKGANQAVALSQLGVPTSLVAVLGEDDAGTQALRQARADGLDTTRVVRRGVTALLVDVVEQGGPRRLLEDVPDEALLRLSDVQTAAPLLAAAGTVSLQLQQPAEVLLVAVEHASHHALVVLDGAPQGDREAGSALLRRCDVLRTDAAEAEQVAGEPVTTVEQAQRLLELGPHVAAVGLPGGGDLLVWPDGALRLPPSDGPVVDATGGGDTFTAALVAAFRTGASPEAAGRIAARATASTVARLGGRPDLAQFASAVRQLELASRQAPPGAQHERAHDRADE
jgi:ribokinase